MMAASLRDRELFRWPPVSWHHCREVLAWVPAGVLVDATVFGFLFFLGQQVQVCCVARVPDWLRHPERDTLAPGPSTVQSYAKEPCQTQSQHWAAGVGGWGTYRNRLSITFSCALDTVVRRLQKQRAQALPLLVVVF